MKLKEALLHAARFSVNPTFSLFHVSSKGAYDLIVSRKTVGVFGGYNPDLGPAADEIVERFKAESLKDSTFGLEVRCEGVRVEFSGTH